MTSEAPLAEIPPCPPATVVTTAQGPVQTVDHGDGPPVLAIHGAMGGHDQSWFLARTLGVPGYRYLAVSRPGYLDTPLAGKTTPEAQADLHAALLDALGLDRVAVMAVSGGGPSALHFAARHPDRCAALVLASVPGGPMRQRPPLAFHLSMLLLRWPAFVRRARAKLAADFAPAAARSIRDPEVRARTLADPVVRELFHGMTLSTFDRPADRLLGTKHDIRMTRDARYPLERVAAPTLVIAGTADPLLPFDEHGAVLGARIPGAKRVVVEGGEHVAIFTHRAEVRPAVVDFLARHWPAAPGMGLAPNA
ncbi:MAG: alpha/beta hydrolase [Deltaproteobacteria bacterium]|nr:MAG: alpha/beta hydrolase [Deltaproteobacteria bacterium]